MPSVQPAQGSLGAPQIAAGTAVAGASVALNQAGVCAPAHGAAQIEPCPGQRSPVSPPRRVACCRDCGRYQILADGKPVAQHNGTTWACDAWVAKPLREKCDAA